MKNKTSLIFMYILIFSLFNSQAQGSNDFTIIMKEEAKLLKKNKVLYQEYLAKEDSLFLKYTHLLKNRPQLHVHRRPNLSAIEAPLAYYFIRFKNAKNKERYRDYLTAISVSKDDKNKIDFIFYIKKNHENLIEYWDRFIVELVNTTWVNAYISSEPLRVEDEKRVNDLLSHQNLKTYPNRIPDRIIKVWADSLNKGNKEKSYRYLVKLYANGDNFFKDADFELLYKLKPTETINELVNHLYYEPQSYTFITRKDGTTQKIATSDTNRPNNKTIRLFADFTTKNRPAANKLIALRKEIPLGEQKYINTAIYFLNPEQGKKEVVSFLEKEIQGKVALEDNYFNARKVLKNFTTDLCKSSEDISILISYLKSDKLDIYGDIVREGVLEAIYNESSKYFEEVLLALRAHKAKIGKDSKVLKQAEKIEVEMKKSK